MLHINISSILHATMAVSEIIVIDMDKLFMGEVEGLLAKYGSSVINIRRHYPQTDSNCIVLANIISNRDVIRQELLQAHEDGLPFIESIGFMGSFAVFVPNMKALFSRILQV